MNQNNAKIPPGPTAVGPGGKYKERKKSPAETPTRTSEVQRELGGANSSERN